MRRQIEKMMLLVIAGLFIAPAYAAEKMKPGLWEMRIKSDSMKDAPKRPQMTPQQIEQMKKMGISMPTMENGEMIQKVCYTKEMVEKDFSAMGQQHKDQQCKSENVKHTGSDFSMDLICDGDTLKGKGTMKGSFKGGDNIQSTYDFKGTSRGKPVTHHVETKGKFLSTDCGDVKPFTAFSNKAPSNTKPK
jgi:hypothetical protein